LLLLGEYAFGGTNLKVILEIPHSVKVLSRFCFYDCKSFELVTFESGSELERIEERAFFSSGLKTRNIVKQRESIKK
jgi:hypothetical protein